ncbi:MAG: AAA family ATPase, partial [Planctomycetota bacterium]|nr:AAA family ATPase [Planctomycetota bacterium]
HVFGSHPEPAKAKQIVNSVMDAYYELHVAGDQLSMTGRQRALDVRQKDLEQQLKSIREQILRIADEYGADMLPEIHQTKIEELGRLNTELNRIEFALADAEARGGEGIEGGAELELTDEILAMSDPRLGDLRSFEAQIVAEMRSKSSTFGPRHRTMVALQRELDGIRDQIEARLVELRSRADAGMVPEEARLAQLSRFNAKELGELRANTQRRRDSIEEEVKRLARQQNQIEELQRREEETLRYLQQTSDQLERLRVESQNTTGISRVVIAQRADLPTEARDSRKKLAAAAGGFGAMVGVGLVFLIGLADRGYRYIDDVERGCREVPLLGTLPDLAARDDAHDEMAALSVHHLRNTLQVQHRQAPNSPKIYTITSASAGDGKTSLTLALGMSFAVSGKKTLLLDADLVGRGLTRELGLDREPGLCEVVGNSEVNGEIKPSTVDNLWTLPAGCRGTFQAKHLSREGLASVLDGLRGKYDTILIDTGPVLGSLEANLAAELSDGVLLTISRGQSRKLVRAC